MHCSQIPTALFGFYGAPCESIFKIFIGNGISWKIWRKWDWLWPSTISCLKVTCSRKKQLKIESCKSDCNAWYRDGKEKKQNFRRIVAAKLHVNKILRNWWDLERADQTKRMRPTGTFFDPPFRSYRSLEMTSWFANHVAIMAHRATI
jgi:hypothetical protein